MVPDVKQVILLQPPTSSTHLSILAANQSFLTTQAPIKIEVNQPELQNLEAVPFMCKIRVCSHISNDFDSYMQHLASAHSGVLRGVGIVSSESHKPESWQSVCKICNKVLDKKILRNHVSSHLPRSENCTCKACGKVCDDPSLLRKHMKIVHSGEKVHSCDQCDKTFARADYLRNHMQLHKGARYKCDVCGKQLVFKRNFLVHKFKCMPESEGVKCKICNKNYFDVTQLNRHITNVHQVDGNGFKCKSCDEVLKNIYYLKLHRRTVHRKEPKEETPHKCDICNKSYALPGALKVHLRRSHLNASTFICDVCGKELTTSASLRDHKLNHAGIKPFQCHDCGKSFVSKTIIRIHCASHKGLRRFTCPTCHGKFTQRSALVVHMRSHTGEKPYKCDLCDKAFVTKTIMNTHKKKKHKVAR